MPSDQREPLDIINSFIEEAKNELHKAQLEEEVLYEGIQSDVRKLQLTEEKKDPNRALFHTTDTELLDQNLNKLRNDLFQKEEAYKKQKVKTEQYKSRLEEIKILQKFIYQESRIIDNRVMVDNDVKIKLLETQELERNRIANDLHDSTIQSLTTVIHKTELAEQLIEVDKERTKIELGVLRETVRAIIKEMREIIFNLRPIKISDLGLWNSVQTYLEQLCEKNDIQYEMKLSPEIENEKQETLAGVTIFKIIQEAAMNCIKHAKASKIIIQAKKNENVLELSVIDDGVGFDKKNVIDHEKYGLKIIIERISLLSGKMEIITNGNGTELRFFIPEVHKEETVS